MQCLTIATMVQKGMAGAVVNLIARIAARFDVIVTEKMVAESLPLVGAATGATIDIAFMDPNVGSSHGPRVVKALGDSIEPLPTHPLLIALRDGSCELCDDPELCEVRGSPSADAAQGEAAADGESKGTGAANCEAVA
jgi:hypothetical protein